MRNDILKSIKTKRVNNLWVKERKRRCKPYIWLNLMIDQESLRISSEVGYLW
jgi:hypothetical protein